MSRYVSEELRRLVALRAGYCCEYCKFPENLAFFSFQVDHIISIKHGGLNDPDNLSWACYPCNMSKGSDVGTILFPDRAFVRLFNPRTDIWDDHFEFDNGVIRAKTKIGEATVKVLRINQIERVIERQGLDKT
ncbi:MAG: HNH endonuclease [Saprospiraceae bacterium]|nr:HNH endonuclease [Saprospiraceae bacterium]